MLCFSCAFLQKHVRGFLCRRRLKREALARLRPSPILTSTTTQASPKPSLKPSSPFSLRRSKAVARSPSVRFSTVTITGPSPRSQGNSPKGASEPLPLDSTPRPDAMTPRAEQTSPRIKEASHSITESPSNKTSLSASLMGSLIVNGPKPEAIAEGPSKPASPKRSAFLSGFLGITPQEESPAETEVQENGPLSLTSPRPPESPKASDNSSSLGDSVVDAPLTARKPGSPNRVVEVASPANRAASYVMSMLGGSYAGEGVGESSEGQSNHSGEEGKGKAKSPRASGFLANFSRLSLGEPDAGTTGEVGGSSRMEGQEGTPRPVRMFHLFPQKQAGKEGEATAVGGGGTGRAASMLTDMFADAFSFHAAEAGSLGEATGSGGVGTYTGEGSKEMVHRTKKAHSNRLEV